MEAPDQQPTQQQPSPVYQSPGGYQGPPAQAPARNSGKATASLVLGIIGIVILPLVFSVLAIIYAVLARRDMDRDPSLGGRGLATAGLVTGIIGLVIGAFLVIFLASGGKLY